MTTAARERSDRPGPAGTAASGVPGAGRRRGRLRGKLLAAALSLGAALLVGEGLVRAWVGAPMPERLPLMRMQANRYRGWMMVPNELHYTYQHPVHVNSLGLRGPEVGPKEAGTVRVLALGDSLVYGQGVADDQTLPSHVEQALNRLDERGRRWEVVNGGHRAYDTRQELGLLEELAPTIQPDAVVLFWYWNDLLGRRIQDTYERLKPIEPVVFDTGDRMEGWSGTKWRLKQLTRRSALVMFVHDLIGWKKSSAFNPELRTNGLARAAGYLDDFVEKSGRFGCVPVFAVVPDPREIPRAYVSAEIGAEAAGLAEERGVETVMLDGAVRGVYESEGRVPTLPFDGHYESIANAAMGERVARALLALPRFAR